MAFGFLSICLSHKYAAESSGASGGCNVSLMELYTVLSELVRKRVHFSKPLTDELLGVGVTGRQQRGAGTCRRFGIGNGARPSNLRAEHASARLPHSKRRNRVVALGPAHRSHGHLSTSRSEDGRGNSASASGTSSLLVCCPACGNERDEGVSWPGWGRWRKLNRTWRSIAKSQPIANFKSGFTPLHPA